ncbi:hypothetical protein [Streptomyces sp. NPDC020489]|uniref:hypothetical protein n=1 Tax=Streptomyces sp. NPDC020489 TaxID=3365077 RepID=UPI0037AC4DE6
MSNQSDPVPADTCRSVEVDGETVRVRASGELGDREQEFLADLVRAAKERFLTEQAVIVQRVIGMYRGWRAADPPIGTSSRWWNDRVQELGEALSHHIDAAWQPYDNPLMAREKWALRLVGILADLDRCQHGRHEGDPCGSCGGLSTGNPYLGPGRVIGHGVYGNPIVLPTRDRKTDPAAWRTTKDTK